MFISNTPTDPDLRAAYEAGRGSRQGQIDALSEMIKQFYEVQKSLTDEICTLREIAIAQMHWQTYCEQLAICFEFVGKRP